MKARKRWYGRIPLAMVIAMATVLLPVKVQCDETTTVLNLNGRWKFEIGDDKHRAEKGYDDSKWDDIRVPSAWEDAGFPGYDGYAWYRKHFTLSRDLSGMTLFLLTGPIDDVDQIFVNGHMIGTSGKFPPDFETAYNIDRRYRLLPEYLNPSGDNVIAVRVYDDGGAGGFLWGDVKIVNVRYTPQPDMPIVSGWKLNLGDDMKWKDPQFDDSGWNSIAVPGCWDCQGYSDFDGIAWYRVKFRVSSEYADGKYVMLLGKIDDLDESFLNGEKIGNTGTIKGAKGPGSVNNEYQRLRAYFIPPGLLKAGSENVLAIRVYDAMKYGGICEGPIGLIRRDRFQKWQGETREDEHRWNFWDWLVR